MIEKGEDGFSPKAFLKARRPERFSDTVSLPKAEVERASLEYHLDVLTSKKQETAFEGFARRLAQKAICPNLLPQTGPTGGGDSKVDSETYPVADALTWQWYVGVGREASEERWAFAFSAKKAWRQKLKKDIAGVAGTGRGYAKAFFVTNQYVRDKDRASLEDELTKLHGLDVRILDRTWILDTVFEQGHEDLVVEYLGVGQSQSTVAQGPKDAERGRQLEEAEQRIKAALESGGTPAVGLADDAILALELSRELERPEVELRGLMGRAVAIADRFGTPQQRVEARYQAAWTAFWWLEQPQEVAPYYDELASAVAGTINARDLELLTNLWFLLQGAATRGSVDALAADIDGKAAQLLQELARLAAEESRPSASLQARTLALHIKLSKEGRDPEARQAVVSGLTAVVQDCAGLVGYPLEPLVSLLLEVGEVLEDVPGYDALFDRLTATWATRKGEVEASRLHLARGAKQLDNNRPAEAVATIGKALTRLYKHESRQELVHALYLAGGAYRRIGLLWAARGTLLSAASTATAEFWTYGDITNAQLACAEELRWVELELGRLPQSLCWHEVALAFAAGLDLSEDAEASLADRNLHFDVVLGMLFFRLDLKDLSHIERLPDALERLDLDNAAVALQWMLGEAHVPTEFTNALGEDDDAEVYFSKWASQPAASQLRQRVELGRERQTELESWVLGCNVRVTADASSPSLELAESFIGALEALLATGTLHDVIAREPRLRVEIRQSEYADSPFSFKITEELGRPRIDVFVRPFDPTRVSRSQQTEIKEKLLKLVMTAVARTVHAADVDAWLGEILGGEEAVSRAIDFTSSFITASNVLGNEPRLSIEGWQNEGDHSYRVLREEAWEPLPVEFPDLPEGAGPDQTIAGEGSDRLDHLTHRDMRTYSVIREQLWNEAGWSGTVFVWTPDGAEPPVMAPIFRNARAAEEIFEGWREDIGAVDHDEHLRVSIVRGVNASHPAWYRISIGTNLDAVEQSRIPGSAWVSVSRHHEMNASSTENLDRFLQRYEELGSYYLMPALLIPGEEQPRFARPLGIRKTCLLVRNAWEIGRHDLDAVMFKPEDEPVLPTDGRPTAVTELLAWLKAK